MASGQVFDPLTLLRTAPLVTTSSSLWYCWDQYVFFNNFIIPANRAKGSELLPSYWKSLLTPALGAIFGLYGTSITAGLANVYLEAPASRWYGLGVALSAAHFAFVPAVAYKIQAIVEDESRGQSWRDMRRWLNVHLVRSLVVDLPGWICFLIGAMKSLRAA